MPALPKLTENVQKSILDKLGDGGSLTEICRSMKITTSGVYALIRRDPGFKELYEEALEQGNRIHEARVKEFSREGYLKRLRGYDVEEVTVVEDAEGNVISRTRKTRHVAPNANLILAAAQRLEPFMRDDAAPEGPTATLNVHFRGPYEADVITEVETES